MKIGGIIRTRRLALELTQEQLARRLGVTAAAVNKWERGGTYPDITLLPPLARTLGVDLNTLLCFQEDLTKEEIADFSNGLAEAARNEGAAAAFQMAREKLREFPNSDLLAYTTAAILEGSLALRPEEAENDDLRREITALYERCAGSADPVIREQAGHMLIVRYLGQNELARAETMLAQLPDTDVEKPRLEAALRRKQGRAEEARTVLEQELLRQALRLQPTLLSLIDLAAEQEDQASARAFAETAARAAQTLGLWAYAAESPRFQLALAEQDGVAALASLEKLLDSLATPWDLHASPLYRHIPVKNGEHPERFLQSLLELLEKDPTCAFLREEPGYQDLIRKFRA